tara:strand:- start:41 stop:490 length:450 start_codon:yes stop_codon:yes gene_type:complete
MNTNDILNRALNFDHKTASDDDLTAMACELAQVVAIAQTRLEDLKPTIRQRATHMRGSESHVQFQTNAGRVSVTFPSPRYKARKGIDWDRMRSTLGDRFDMYFTTKVTHGVRKDIEQVVKTRTASVEIGTVLEALSRDEPTPRVGFKPN